jgi:hypothetical protein
VGELRPAGVVAHREGVRLAGTQVLVDAHKAALVELHAGGVEAGIDGGRHRAERGEDVVAGQLAAAMRGHAGPPAGEPRDALGRLELHLDPVLAQHVRDRRGDVLVLAGERLSAPLDHRHTPKQRIACASSAPT